MANSVILTRSGIGAIHRLLSRKPSPGLLKYAESQWQVTTPANTKKEELINRIFISSSHNYSRLVYTANRQVAASFIPATRKEKSVQNCTKKQSNFPFNQESI
jgi:hypothetical protein